MQAEQLIWILVFCSLAYASEDGKPLWKGEEITFLIFSFPKKRSSLKELSRARWTLDFSSGTSIPPPKGRDLPLGGPDPGVSWDCSHHGEVENHSECLWYHPEVCRLDPMSS